MQGGFYDHIFSKHGVTVVAPSEKDQDYINEKYMGELVKGIIRDDTKTELLKIVNNLQKSSHIQGLILGGTELPLILKDTDAKDIPFLDTTQIHVESIMKKLV